MMKGPAKTIKSLTFVDPLVLLRDDTLEFDFNHRRVMVVNKLGKVKSHSRFILEEISDGESVAAGEG